MDESIEEVNAAGDCCVGCLTKDENKLSNADVSGLLKDFLNREVNKTFFFAIFVVIMRNLILFF